MRKDNCWLFGAQFVKPHAERKRYFTTFTQFLSVSHSQLLFGAWCWIQFSTLLLLDIARQKVPSKIIRKLKIEIYVMNRKGDQSVDLTSTCYYRKVLLVQAANDEERVISQRTWRM